MKKSLKVRIYEYMKEGIEDTQNKRQKREERRQELRKLKNKYINT